MQADSKGKRYSTCGHDLTDHTDHPECDACHIWIGPNHPEQFLVPFMGHYICGGCNSSTVRKLLASDWKEFIEGIPLKRIAEYRRQKERRKIIDGETLKFVRSIY